MVTTEIEQIKEVVLRFNKEVLEQGDLVSFGSIMAEDFVNHTAVAGMSPKADGMLYFVEKILHSAFSDVKVMVHQQVAEGDMVTTRKTISGTHTGDLMGILPTNKKVQINVIDMVRIKDGKYSEHWGQNNFAEVVRQLAG